MATAALVLAAINDEKLRGIGLHPKTIQWHIQNANGQFQTDALSTDDLKLLLAVGKILPTTIIRRQIIQRGQPLVEREQLKEAKEFPGFAGLLGALESLNETPSDSNE